MFEKINILTILENRNYQNDQNRCKQTSVNKQALKFSYRMNNIAILFKFSGREKSNFLPHFVPLKILSNRPIINKRLPVIIKIKHTTVSIPNRDIFLPELNAKFPVRTPMFEQGPLNISRIQKNEIPILNIVMHLILLSM